VQVSPRTQSVKSAVLARRSMLGVDSHQPVRVENQVPPGDADLSSPQLTRICGWCRFLASVDFRHFPLPILAESPTDKLIPTTLHERGTKRPLRLSHASQLFEWPEVETPMLSDACDPGSKRRNERARSQSERPWKAGLAVESPSSSIDSAGAKPHHELHVVGQCR